jgi:CRP-like cAMP-binding protein
MAHEEQASKKYVMTTSTPFALDVHRLNTYRNHLLNSGAVLDAIPRDELSSDERLFLLLWDTPLLQINMLPAGKKIIDMGQEYEEAYFIISGEVSASSGDKTFDLGPGAVLGLAEGMVYMPSRFTIHALTTLQVKIIPFHKVDNIVHQLPPELKSMLVTMIKRNLVYK